MKEIVSHGQTLRTVQQMSEEISAQVRSLFDDPALPLLKPMIEGERRFLSSDVCIRIARRRSIDPAELARQLVKSIHPIAGEGWAQHAGYLNVTFADQEVLPNREAVVRRSEISEVTIFIPSRPASISQSGMLRLAAPAILQAWLLKLHGVEARLLFGTERIALGKFETLEVIWKRLVQFAVSERASEGLINDRVLEIWHRYGGGSCCFYLFPGDVEHSLWREGGRETGFDERVHVYIPDRGWLADIDQPCGQAEFLGESQDRYLSLLLHLCSSSRGADIEWHSPLFAERKNLLWSLNSLRQRIAQLMPVSDAAPQGGPILPPEVGFLIRFLPDFYFQALSAGEVVSWVQAMATFLEQASVLLNDPSLRIETSPGVRPLGRLCPSLADATSTIYSFFHVD